MINIQCKRYTGSTHTQETFYFPLMRKIKPRGSWQRPRGQQAGGTTAQGAASPHGAGPGRGGWARGPAGLAPSQTSLLYQEMAEEEVGTEAEASAGAAALGAWLTVSPVPAVWGAPARGPTLERPPPAPVLPPGPGSSVHMAL